jgi:transposase
MLEAAGEVRHMSISEHEHVSNARGDPVRRFEVFTGSGRRRNWSAEDKAAIVAESYSGGDTVCGTARRHGLTPQQLFTWRRQARQRMAALEAPVPSLFVPAVVEATAPKTVPEPERELKKAGRGRRSGISGGIIEVEIDGVTVRVGRGAEARTVTAVLRALKGLS